MALVIGLWFTLFTHLLDLSHLPYLFHLSYLPYLLYLSQSFM